MQEHYYGCSSDYLVEKLVLNDQKRKNYRFTVIVTAALAVCVILLWIVSDSWWVKAVFGLVLLTNLYMTGKMISEMETLKRQRFASKD